MSIEEGIVLGILIGFSVYDIKTKRIPVMAALIFGIIVLAYGISKKAEILELAAGTVPGLTLLLLAYVTKESIGFGDGLVLCMIGLFCGLEETLVVFSVALMSAAFLAMILLVMRRVKRKTELPFLPCLCLGYLVSLL